MILLLGKFLRLFTTIIEKYRVHFSFSDVLSQCLKSHSVIHYAGNRVSKTRIILFSFIYFVVLSGYIAYLMMRTLASVEPDALIWYLTTYSLDQIIFVVVGKIGNNLVVVFGFISMVLLALFFGFLTELGVSFLKKITVSKSSIPLTKFK